jgi:three-Cys-motif partner protein
MKTEELGNNWGGSWTEQKMIIFVKYVKAYLDIMEKQKWAKTLYFDGFAGSGEIESPHYDTLLEGVAMQVLELNHNKPFDMYYLVDKDKKKVENLSRKIKSKYPNKFIHCVSEDCNIKLVSMCEYMRKNKNYRASASNDQFCCNN